ncbi:MAG: hypothetical protein P8X55_07185, partial [Desulfosarcinaceae bacterium]
AALDRILAQYRDWADLHRGNLEAVTGFLSAKQGPAPLVDETDPSQIHTQLRHYGDAGPDQAREQLMQAAVFMAMAHEFDSGQDDVSKELEAVNRTEQQMFKGLAGDADEMGAIFSPAGKARQERSEDPGLFCTDKRVQSWAVLAYAAAPEAFVYLTTSKAVFDTICDAFPQMVPLVAWPLAAPGFAEAPPLLSEQQVTRLRELANVQDLAAAAEPFPSDQPPDGQARASLVVHGVSGCSPASALGHLAASGNAPGDMAENPAKANTLFAYLETGGACP